MFYLVFAIISSTLIIIAFKLFPKYNISVIQAITVNYLIACVFGYASEPDAYTFSELPSRPWFASSLLVGLTLIIGFNLFAITARKTGVVITAIASRMSVMIPVTLGFLVFSEKTTWIKLAGIILALAAFYMTFLRKQSVKPDLKFLFFPSLLFLAIGINDSLMKFAQYQYIGDDYILFLSTAFLSSLILGIIILFFRSGSEKWALKNILAGIFVGLLNWFSTYYFLRGLGLFDVTLVVPVINAGIVALSTVAGFFLFREKLLRINWVGVLTALAAILLMAMAGYVVS